MMRVPLLTELLAPGVALVIVVVAAATRQAALLMLLPLLWFAPAWVRRTFTVPLDEREETALRGAEAGALRLLLLAASALPWLLQAGGATTLLQESADLGFLVLAVFVARALLLGAATLPAGSGAQAAGAMALLVAAVLSVGRAWPTPWIPALVIGLAAVPHLVAPVAPGLAGLLWGGGALLVAASALFAGFVPIEIVLLVLLLALPWAAAGVLASRSGRQLADA